MRKIWLAVLLACVGSGACAAPRVSAHGVRIRQQGAAVPVELTRLTQQAAKAATDRDFRALAPLVSGDAAQQMAWVRETTTSVWAGDALAVPMAADRENAPIYLAVFHAWHTCESDGDHVHVLTHTPQGWRLGAEIPETETGGFRVRDHDLTVALEVTKKTALLRDRVRIERTERALPAYGLLRLSQDFRVRSLTQNSPDGCPVSFQQVGGILAFAPPAGKTFTLAMQYAGVVNHEGSDYIHDTEATLNSYWYPHIARLPATATVTATAPPGWIPISQGDRLQTKQENNGALTLTFRNEIPTCYFTVNMGKYHVTSRTVKGRTLSTYFLKDNPTLAARSLDLLENALDFFETHFAPYPYKRYALVETLGSFSGALEAYTFATFGPGTLPGALVHELSHTWWGGIVPCTYTRSMWNESFAEYSDGLFRRMTHPESSRTRDPAARFQGGQRQALAFSFFPMSRAHDTSDGRQSAVGYGKGPRVLRVLEDEIGQETMLKCLSTFIAERRRGEAAEWPDFEAVVVRVTGKDYHWFFQQWLERTGLPIARLTDVTTQQEGQETIVEADVVQEGTPYRLTIPLRLELEGGAKIETMVTLAEPRTHVRLRASAAPTRLILDPADVLPLNPPEKSASNELPTVHDFAASPADENSRTR